MLNGLKSVIRCDNKYNNPTGYFFQSITGQNNHNVKKEKYKENIVEQEYGWEGVGSNFHLFDPSFPDVSS